MDASKLNILIVDDTRANLRFLAGILGEQGYLVRPVPDGSLALTSAWAEQPDLILLDIKMPNMSGYEVCERLKADARTREIPVIFISALADTADKVKAFTTGGVDYITKPFQVEEVLARVETHLTLRNLQKSLQEKNHQLQEEIAERKHAETESRKERDAAQMYLDIAGVMFLAIDQDENVSLINKKGCEILECEETDILGKNWFEHFLPESSRERVRKVYQQVMAEEMPSSECFENHVLTRKREVREIAWHSTLLRNDQGHVMGVFSSGEDITERRRLESQIRRTHKMEAIGTLAGGIAHDFNNILWIVLGNAELATNKIPKENPAQSNLEAVRKASLRAKDVVQQLLSFSRQTDQVRTPIKIGPLIRESLRLLRSSVPANIDIRQHLPDDLRMILADPTQIRQMIINLCTNAAHAMEEDGGVIEIRLANAEFDENAVIQYHGLKPGRYVKLTVSDTGTGIRQEAKERIFDPYFTTKEVGKGSGMGLSVVHGIVRDHGGTVSVHSEIGKGSVFSICFPIIEQEEQETPDEIIPPLPPGGTERILFVDDEVSLAKMGEERLRRLGYDVEARTDPEEALSLFLENPAGFDLVITDMSMPHMTGDVLAKRILDERPEMPIILCTGFSERITEEKAKSVGIRKYIEKPIGYADFALAIRDVLDERSEVWAVSAEF